MKRELQILMMSGLIASCTAFLAIPANGVPAHRQDSAETPQVVFKAKCAMCHGEDGTGSSFGKSFHVKDLTSKEVQSESDESMRQVIIAGKNPMPAFGTVLSPEMTDELLKYIRALGKDRAPTAPPVS